ncbi:MAG: ribulose-phosphate 3-epimerase [Anaerolineales bacterium]|nr:ribulose-phosphate 3-epimerase [Anaerolineales bacterium]
MNVKIAPSILSADFSRLGQQVQAALDAGAEYIHVDIMDGHFVPNMTVGPLIVEAVKPFTEAAGATLDVHLMITNPDRLVPAFAQAGADILIVHVETCDHMHRTIQQIKELGVKAGVTLNPATPLNTLEEILPLVHQVLVMTVNPGFGGQSYIPASNDKVSRLRHMLDERGLSHVELEVDGGIKPSNTAEVVAAGATVLVVGSAIFNDQASIADNINALRKAVGEANK